jgi:wyosine [tRNA(Phe)-imidazoG37] synthetase (radical SAM superfamily)
MKSYRYLYGPVPSRRLGRSLGVDLIPHKVCTYNCIYCQIGETTEKTLIRKEYVPVNGILNEVETFLLRGGIPLVDYLSLGGSGEPTLHSEIGRIIEGVKAITSIPLAVITNGALLYDQEVKEDLLKADVVLPSMDAVSPEVFEKINRPYPGFSVQRIIEGLGEFRKAFKGQIWLEILFCKGVNDKPEEIKKMKKVIERIQPDLIHLNTVVRPPSEKWATPLNQREMEEIRGFFGESAFIISGFDRHPLVVSKRDIREEILKILKRRPLSQSDLSKGMGIPLNDLENYIRPLLHEGKIKIHFFGDSIYYETK